MRSLAIILLLTLTASASATVSNDPAKGDIETYDRLFPPPVIVEDIYPRDIDTKTFILVEGALLVPDRIRLIEAQEVYEIEVVDDQELDRFESVVKFRLPETLDLDKLKKPGTQLIRYEQRMWREGLRLAFREYRAPGDARVRYTAFRVTFEPCGNLYRAALTLYQAVPTLGERFDVATKRLGEILNALAAVRQEVSQAGKNVRAAFDSLKKAVASLDSEVNALDNKIKDLDTEIGSLKSRIHSLEQTE